MIRYVAEVVMLDGSKRYVKIDAYGEPQLVKNKFMADVVTNENLANLISSLHWERNSSPLGLWKGKGFDHRRVILISTRPAK